MGHIALREAVVGGPALHLPSPAPWPETSQPPLGQKPSPGGLPPVLRSGEHGTEGSAVSRNLGRGLPAGPRGPSPREAEGLLLRDAGVLQGQGKAWELSRQERELGP